MGGTMHEPIDLNAYREIKRELDELNEPYENELAELIPSESFDALADYFAKQRESEAGK